MKKLMVALLILAVASLGVSAAPKTVGFSLWTMEYTFFQAVEKGVRDACKDLGYKYVMIDQNAKADKMVNDLATLVGMKVDGIVVTPVDPGAIGPAVQKARAAKIPVVCADIGKSGPVNALMISNNFKGGQMAMDQLDKLFKQKGVTSRKVGVGRTPPQFTYAKERGNGFVARAKELGYTVATDLVVQVTDAQGGYDVMQQMLSAVPDLAGEAVGAANAIKAAGKDILVVRYNGDPEEIQAMKDGIMAADIAQQPYYIGYESVKLLARIWAGEKFEDAVVPVDVALLTPSNVDEFQKKVDALMKK